MHYREYCIRKQVYISGLQSGQIDVRNIAAGVYVIIVEASGVIIKGKVVGLL